MCIAAAAYRDAETLYEGPGDWRLVGFFFEVHHYFMRCLYIFLVYVIVVAMYLSQTANEIETRWL